MAISDLKPRCQQRCIPFREGSIFLLSLASIGGPHSLAYGPILHLESQVFILLHHSDTGSLPPSFTFKDCCDYIFAHLKNPG
jgi:hypothetical protein